MAMIPNFDLTLFERFITNMANCRGLGEILILLKIITDGWLVQIVFIFLADGIHGEIILK